jgi:hypothetical protein
MRKTLLICLCGSEAVSPGQVDCSCGSEVIFDNKPLSKDFTELDRLMRVLLGQKTKGKLLLIKERTTPSIRQEIPRAPESGLPRRQEFIR